MMHLLILMAACLAQASGGDWGVTTKISGIEDNSNFSVSLASITDLDGDGIRDFIVGDLRSHIAGFAAGAVYVYSGRTGILLFSFYGESDSAAFGNEVADAGDVDADGYHDILIGALYTTNLAGVHAGAAYVFSGRDGHLIYRFLGNASVGGSMGASVSGIGDLNSDGCDDFLVGDPYVDPVPGSTGVIWAFSGRDGSVLRPIVIPGQGTGGRVKGVGDLNQDGIPDLLTASNGVIVQSGADGTEIRRHADPFPNDNFGSAMSNLGDLDFDGVEDYAIGASASFTDRNGRVYVYSGSSGALIWEFYGKESRGEFGYSVAGPGDVDGDGYPDILIGAERENSTVRRTPGAAHLFSGYSGSLISYFTESGPSEHLIGISVAAAGDVNNDGLADVAIGSFSSANGGVRNGVVRTYALHSYLNLSPRTVSAAAGGTIGFQLDFPDTEAGKKYVLLASGGVPGRTLVLDHWLPVARTPLLDRMVHNPPSFITGGHGTLNAQGDATAAAVFAPNQSAAWIGRSIKFVAVSFDGPLDISLYSAAMSLAIEP